MSARDELIYEVTLSVEDAHADALDEWLAHHVRDMLAVPGLFAATTYRLDREGDRERRVTHYHFENDEHLQQYLAGPAQTLRQATEDRFGAAYSATRRVLTDAEPTRAEPQTFCKNCGAALTGQYCGACGQRASNRLISLWELVKDAFGDLFELESRLWRTLIPLAVRPGHLTRDYLLGRRARYMPPFRMYLVLSLTFFLIAFFDPRNSLPILFEPATEAPGAMMLDSDFEDLREELAEEGIDFQPAAGEAAADESGLATCSISGFDASEMPEWLARRLTRERVEAACLRVFDVNGPGLGAFLDKLAESVPTALFVVLPLMALVLKLLYPLSRRYYVEHLLFVLHFHSFVFLALSLQVLMARLTPPTPIPDGISGLLSFALFVYVPVYLFKAQRRVYEQGRLLSVAKFLALTIAYLVGLTLILIFAALFAAFSA